MISNSQTQLPDEPFVVEGDVTSDDAPSQIIGLENIDIACGQYFNPMKGVKAYSLKGVDVTSRLKVIGHVEYGKVGTYTLKYILEFNNSKIEKNRTIQVLNKAINRESYSNSNDNKTIYMGSGSYMKSSGGNHFAPPAPTYLENELKNKPIPTNSWWTTMLNANYGGSNGIYNNPLRMSFLNEGVEITETTASFVQYWTDNEKSLSVADFQVAIKDVVVKANSLNANYITKVIDYSDNAVKIAMRNSDMNADEMVVSIAQGSPYAFFETKSNSAYLSLNPTCQQPYEFLDLNGNKVESNYVGEAIIVKMPRAHVGYICEIPTTINATIVKEPVYKDKYYLVNVPSQTTFTMNRVKHANSAFFDQLSMTFTNGNYFSVSPIQNIEEAKFYHLHGYSFILDASTSFSVDHDKGVVNTYYSDSYMNVNGQSENSPLLALLPHQYKNSDAHLTSKTIRSYRGTLKILEGSIFKTRQNFAGLLPTYTTPNDSETVDKIKQYLQVLDQNTNHTYGDSDENRKGPYWDAKTIYPLAQGVIYASQIKDEVMKNKMLGKLKNYLADWFKYDGKSDEKYLIYDDVYKTMYYSNNEFNTASELSDHHFTHGYLVFASAVCMMFDEEFKNQYEDVTSMLLGDYLNYSRESSVYPYFRTFDKWAGHSWAHGFGFFAEGNNQESSGEALNAWTAAYLFGLQSENQALIDSAIYGFVTELGAIKQYVFDYDLDILSEEYLKGGRISAIIWGGKNTYATWFGLNPNFIYGIHFLPIGEYISSYALNDKERESLKSIYQSYEKAVVGHRNCWMANMWSIKAMFDVQASLNNFDENKIKNDDYPNDLLACYTTIDAISRFGYRTDKYHITNSNVGYDFHQKGNTITVQVWNPTNSNQEIIVKDDANNVVYQSTVEPKSFVAISI